MSFFRSIVLPSILLALTGSTSALVAPRNPQCIPNPSVVTVEVIQTLVVCPVLLSTFVSENTKITLAPDCTVEVTNAPTSLSTIVTITTLSESSITHGSSSLVEASGAPAGASLLNLGETPSTVAGSTKSFSPSSIKTSGKPGSTSTSISASSSQFGSLPGVTGLIPIPNQSCDQNDLTNLVPSYTANLEYANSIAEGATEDVSLRIQMLYPQVTLENSAYIKSVALSDCTIIITLKDESAFDTCKHWPQGDFVLITNSAGCNPTDERGIYLVSGFHVDASTLEIVVHVNACTWDTVAVSVVISYGYGETGVKHPASYTSSTTSQFPHRPSSSSDAPLGATPHGSSGVQSTDSAQSIMTSSLGNAQSTGSSIQASPSGPSVSSLPSALSSLASSLRSSISVDSSSLTDSVSVTPLSSNSAGQSTVSDTSLPSSSLSPATLSTSASSTYSSQSSYVALSSQTTTLGALTASSYLASITDFDSTSSYYSPQSTPVDSSSAGLSLTTIPPEIATLSDGSLTTIAGSTKLISSSSSSPVSLASSSLAAQSTSSGQSVTSSSLAQIQSPSGSSSIFLSQSVSSDLSQASVQSTLDSFLPSSSPSSSINSAPAASSSSESLTYTSQTSTDAPVPTGDSQSANPSNSGVSSAAADSSTLSTLAPASTTGTATSSASSPAQTLSIKPTIGDYTYIGCYSEGNSIRALRGAVTYSYTSMTLETCAQNCAGYTYFGVEYGGECYCDNSIDPSSTLASVQSDCFFLCPGDGYEYCGGSDRLEMYSLGGVTPTYSSSSQIPMTTSASLPAASSSASSTSSGTGITSGTVSAFAGPTNLSSAPKVILTPSLPPGLDTGSLSVLSPLPTAQLWYGGGDNSTSNSTNSTSTIVRLNITYLYPSVMLDYSAYILSVSCSNASLIATFNQTDAFMYAESMWPTNPETLFITAAASCGQNGQNAFFLASSLTFSQVSGMTCTATGAYAQLKDVMSDMDMDWGDISVSSSNSTNTTTTCGSPSSSVINGLPAAACGSSFDQTLDDALGYYSGDSADAQTVFSEVAPGAPSIGPQKRHWWDAVINAVEDVVTYVVNVVVTVVNDAAQIAEEVAQEAAQAAEQAAEYAAMAAEAVVETGIDLVTSTIKLAVALVTGSYSDSFDLPLDIGPPNALLESSPWGPMGFKFYSYTVDPEDSHYSAYVNTLEVISQDLLGNNNNAPGIEFWCLNCGIEGDIKATGTLSASISSGITKGQISISGDVYAGIFLGVNAYAELEKTYTDELFTVGLPGWSIPGIVDLGPELTLAAQAEVRVEVLGQILLGASVTWPSIQATLDFVDSADSTHSGWTPVVQTEFQSQSQITAYASLGMPLTIAFGIDILDGTWEKNINLTESPALAATARYDEQEDLTTSTNTTDGSSAVNFTATPDDGCYGIAWNISLINDVTLNLIGLDSFDLDHWESPALASGCIGAAAVTATGTATASSTSIALLGPPTGFTTAAIPTSTAVASSGGGSCDSVTCPDDDKATCNNGAELFTVSCEVVYETEQLANLNFETLGECINACATTYAGTCRGVSFFSWAWVDPSSPEYQFLEEEGGISNCYPFATASTPVEGYQANSGWSAVITTVSKRSQTPELQRHPRQFRRDDTANATASNSTLDTVAIEDTTGALLLNPGIDGNLFMSLSNSTTNITALNNGSSFMADYTHNIVYGDTQGRLLHYYPAEMTAVNASRLRLAAWGSIPIGAQLVEFAPITIGTDTMLVAFDTLGNFYWPFMCGFEGSLNKVFLVQDLHQGADLLKSADLQFIVTGGIAESCGPLALEAQGLAGFSMGAGTANSTAPAANR